MATKRKSDQLEEVDGEIQIIEVNPKAPATQDKPIHPFFTNASAPVTASKTDDDAPPAKKAKTVRRKLNADEKENNASTSSRSTKGKGKTQSDDKQSYAHYRHIRVDTNEWDEVIIYDDCNEIRRKIRLLQKDPNFKATPWLREIGGIGYSSFQRFMKLTGASAGAEIGLYPVAYTYFEQKRIFEGKKKTAKREKNETERPEGFPLRDFTSKRAMYFGGRRRSSCFGMGFSLF